MEESYRDSLTFRFATRRNAVLFLCAFFIAAGIGGKSTPVAASGVFLFALLICQRFHAVHSTRAIAVKRTHTPRSFEGDDVTVDLEVQNTGRLPAHAVEIVDSFPPSGSYSIRSVALHIPPRAAVHFRYWKNCSGRRGLYVIGPARLTAADPLGLYSFRGGSEEITTLTVYPDAVPVKTLDVLGRGTHLNIGEQVVRHIGRSEEFERVRAYRAGDPLRLIHWPSSARMRSLYIKEFEQEVVTEVTIFCDLYLLALTGLGPLTSVEFRIKAAASIAAATIGKHHLVRVVAVKSPREETRMAGGSAHLIQVLDWFALLKAEGSGSFEDSLADEVRRLRRNSTVVLVTSSVHCDTGKLRNVLGLFHAYSIKVLGVIVEDRSFLKLRKEQDQLFAKAPPLDRISELFKESGATVFTVTSKENVIEQLGLPA